MKARFPIKEDKVNAFLHGQYTMDAEFDELVRRGKKTAAEVENMKQLASEVQYAVLTRKLGPGAFRIVHSSSSVCFVKKGRRGLILTQD